HRGFAFVEFLTPQEAQHVLDTMKDTHLYGRHLVIDWAEEENSLQAIREKVGRQFAKDAGDNPATAGKRRKIEADLERGGEEDDDMDSDSDYGEMEHQAEPLLKYAEELLHSYSRLIVYSGDILRSLPEPREGLSVANIKPKKDESTAFQREWHHLESVFDEYLIRLNDIRTRAHEELEAARVKCLVGESIDLTLPEAAVKLSARLARYKRQYDLLQQVVSGGSVNDLDKEDEGEGDSSGIVGMDVDAVLVGNTVADSDLFVPEAVESYMSSPEDMNATDTPSMAAADDDGGGDDDDFGADELVEGTSREEASFVMSSNVNTPMSVQSAEPTHSVAVDVADEMEVASNNTPRADVIDVDAESSPD
ncbi:Multiple RNA-binding domain-containing protein 1, partial [Coemansia sp. RSA 2052]